MRRAAELTPFILALLYEKHHYCVTPLKLQKIIYYVQAWNLVFKNEALFLDTFEAWIHGPVIPEIYQAYKHYGWNSIPRLISTVSVTSSEREVISVVVEAYGAMTGKALEELTHTESPWRIARAGMHPHQKSNNKVSRQDMKSYYRQFAESLSPPQIAKLATKINKDQDSRNFNQNVLRGVGSVMNVFPAPNLSRDLGLGKGGASTTDSIASYWNKVGSYVRNAQSTVESDIAHKSNDD